MVPILIASALLLAAPKPATKAGKPKPKTTAPASPKPADPPAEPAVAEPAPEPAPAPAPAPVEPKPAPAPVAAPASSPAPAPAPTAPQGKPPLKLAAPGLSQVGINADLATFFSNHLAQQLTLAGVLVTTPSEIQTVLGLERQRQLLGCVEAACAADLGPLLGVDGIVTGALAKVGSDFQLNVKVLDAMNGAGLSAASVTASSEGEMLDAIGRTARAIARELFLKLGRAPVGGTAQADVSSGAMRRRSWIPAAAGVVLAASGVVLLIFANQSYYSLRDSLTTSDLKGSTPEAYASTGQLLAILGLSLTCAGGVALAAAGAMFLFGGEKEQPAVSFVPLASGGAMVGFSGVLP